MVPRAYGVKRNDYDDDYEDDDDDDDNNNNNSFRFAELRSNRPRGLVTHTHQSDEGFNEQRNCTLQCERSTDSSKMRYTTQIR
jgi:hypothetical protein